MSHKHPSTAIEREFELERVALFSDAVFAIAITLLIIDIKWPEGGEHGAEDSPWKHIQPMFLSFAALVISFFFIGRFWSLHLQLFRMLKKYNQGLIKRNLLFLFFIVTFPFTAAGIAGHVREGFLLPLYLYFINITALSAAHFALCRYIVREKSSLSVEGFAAEKKYFYMRALYTTLALAATLVVLIIVDLASGGKLEYVTWTPASIALFLILARKKIKKYKPANVEEY
ncbi:MAG TPA: TMEM175 family protein [Puia sp.]|nr:TMEM175 family protein [Puia sp.]